MTTALEPDTREAQIQARRSQLEAQFRAQAEGHPWFEGTGNDDPIMQHQWVGSCYGAVARRWLLGDEPGAGKTRTSVGWLDLIGAKRVILVAEANICAQFAGEVSALAPHRKIINLAGLSRPVRHERLAQLARLDEGVAVINFEMFRRDQEALGKLLVWRADTVIIDEAHNMKDTATSNFRYMRNIVFAENTCPSCSGLLYGLSRRCESCGWMNPYGTPNKWSRAARSDEEMFFSTKSVKNLMLLTGTPLLNTPVEYITAL